MTYRERKNQKITGSESEKVAAENKASSEIVSPVTTPVQEIKKESEEVAPVSSPLSAGSKKKKLAEGEVHTGFTADQELVKDFSAMANLKGRKNKYLYESFMQSFIFFPKETIEFIEKHSEEGLKK